VQIHKLLSSCTCVIITHFTLPVHRAMVILRCFLFVAASIVLHIYYYPLLEVGASLPLSDTQIANLLWCLKWGFTLWAVRDFNAALNYWAENKWVWTNDTSVWSWKNEIAVVTGGSQGIGACVVKKLVSYGVSCAVLDVVPPTEIFTEGVQHNPSSYIIQMAYI
jgi:all-trans-retinol dehydrogenase (NAD+)